MFHCSSQLINQLEFVSMARKIENCTSTALISLACWPNLQYQEAYELSNFKTTDWVFHIYNIFIRIIFILFYFSDSLRFCYVLLRQFTVIETLKAIEKWWHHRQS